MNVCVLSKGGLKIIMIEKKNLFIKAILFVLCIAGVFCFNTNVVKANSDILLLDKSYDEQKYFEAFYSKEYDILVTNRNDQDVTDYFLEKTNDLFDKNDIESIKNILANENLRMHIIKEEITPIETYALEQFKTVEDFIVDYYTANTGTVMEFACVLKGGIWYNPNTFQVTRTSSPTLDVTYMGVAPGIEPSCNSISTGSSVRSGKGYFWATFTLQGFFSDHGLEYLPLDYGTHTVSFYATP